MGSFQASSRYESWATQLKISWVGIVGRRLLGGWAAVLGDKTVDWMTQALLEHLPGYASSPQSIALAASERLMDTAPSEASASIAARAPFQVQIARYAGSHWGVLLGMHFAGFDGAVIVTQSGRALQLSLPLPAFVAGQIWDPSSCFVITQLSSLIVPMHSDRDLTRSIPAGTPWWTFDSNTDFCSRFAILFPGTLPSAFSTQVSVYFNATQDYVDFTWPNPFSDASYQVAFSVSGNDPAAPLVYVPLASKTAGGARVSTTARGTFQVDLLAWQLGANPYADLHSADLQRLRSVVQKWRPEKATCTGVFALVQGNFTGWPVRVTSAAVPGPFSIAAYTGGF